ncbi:uncharacterized protein H6S33_000343 [Morchella sextelata]|uniref:uncharacterized protein n=1 Tax=Morchella sextelata TaxID=1174677 RepID=UPI001D05761F|nr:uncharacterized protein H6S33_000343 [Morchella sextelata]KAH0614707.1 hypothetical protein H6S33_000343 [Morchella sextelata]
MLKLVGGTETTKNIPYAGFKCLTRGEPVPANTKVEEARDQNPYIPNITAPYDTVLMRQSRAYKANTSYQANTRGQRRCAFESYPSVP